MTKARNLSLLSTVEVAATTDQTKADLNAIGVSGGRKNLIINGRLGTNTMVNQRGFASGTLNDGDYGFDRWLSASGASVLALNADDVTLTSGKLLQWIEAPHISGKQITVSAKVNSGTLTGRVGTGAIAFQTLPFTITAPSGNLRLELVGNGSQFTDVQVELGSVATDFEHRSYGEELALCQRYYYRLNVIANQSLMIGNSLNTTSGFYTLALPQPLRATPSVSISGFTNYRQRGGGVNVTTTVTLGTPHYTVGNSELEIDITVSSGLPNTIQTMVFTSTGSTGYLDADSEL